MGNKKCVAMILTDEQEERRGAFTHNDSKPSDYFGGNNRIIDFTLNNCINSEIETIGILSQSFSTDLHTYIDTVQDKKIQHCNFHKLTPQCGEAPYFGTAEAVHRNIEFIDSFDPECVLILPGDQIYQMNYNEMVAFHRKTNADVTVASSTVPIREASKYTIVKAQQGRWRVYGFEEHPRRPSNNLASMGIYVFRWSVLRDYLISYGRERNQYDFNNNMLPEMLSNGEAVYTYCFHGYWRDVRTVNGLWEANMDWINAPNSLRLNYEERKISGTGRNISSNIMSRKAEVYNSILAGNCSIFGKVENSVLSDSVMVGPNAEIVNSVVMPGVYVGDNAKIYNAVVGKQAIIMDNVVIGAEEGEEFFVDRRVCANGISSIAPQIYVNEGMKVKNNSRMNKERLDKFYSYKEKEKEIQYYRPETNVLYLYNTNAIIFNGN